MQLKQNTAGQIRSKTLSIWGILCNMSDKKPRKGQTSSTGNRCFSLPICKIRARCLWTISGNKYIRGFVDWYSGWLEAFTVPDKTAEEVAHFFLEEITSGYSTPFQIVTDNGSANINRVKKHTARNEYWSCNYPLLSPQGNSKVEQFQWTLHDVMSKVSHSLDTWDIYLYQILAAITFNINESTKFCPFYLLCNHDPVLLVHNIFKQERRYLGDEPHKMALEQQVICNGK